MSPDPDVVREQLRAGGEEYHYRDDNCDIDGTRSGERSIHVGHLVVKRDARGQKIASTLIEALFDVAREDGMTSVTVKMGATECKTMEDLEKQRNDRGDDWQDPSYEFLSGYGFRNLGYEEDWQWGLCVRGMRML